MSVHGHALDHCPREDLSETAVGDDGGEPDGQYVEHSLGLLHLCHRAQLPRAARTSVRQQVTTRHHSGLVQEPASSSGTDDGEHSFASFMCGESPC